jgi:SAM-dependent methyltransferase
LIVLLGGEPFLRPDLLRLVASIRAAGCVPGIVTTGRPLVYPRLRKQLQRVGVGYLRVQFFGTGEAHDRATSVESGFNQAVTGVRAWIAEVGMGCDVDVALNVRRRPLDTLVTEVETLAREIPSRAVQIVIAIDQATAAEAQHAQALQRAALALAHWNDDASQPMLAWEGLDGSAMPTSSLSIAALRPAFVAAEPHACCLGPVAELARSMGAMQQTRANSFNYVRTSTVVPWTKTAAECTAYQATGAPAHGHTGALRHVWLIEDDHLVLHSTDTGDFDAAEITRVKDEWSHLFLDRQAPGVLDDFSEGMRRVLPDATCDPCVHRTQCGRRYRVVEGAPFAREEAWIASYIAGLHGRVLDVGCGEQLYRSELAPLLRAGTVQYIGLDPDEPSLTRIRESLPEGRFQLGDIESFRGEPASYDHILCLRSLNHVVDLDEAMARMAALLKPGGQLLIVETTPFAMLRRPEQVTAADRAPRAGHQHFRNVTSEEVLPYARRRSLLVVEHYPASLATTNEWILLLER